MSTTIPGARGTYTRGYLPHFDHEGVQQAVTFRLADALPNPVTRQAACDAELDLGHGSCVLRNPEVASIVQTALQFFHGERYDLKAWVIMPNHVHVVLQPAPGHALASILHAWKSFTAKRINALLGRTGPLWQREYFDRIIRNQRHLLAEIRYIEQNPVAAGLVQHAEAWPFGSARAMCKM